VLAFLVIACDPFVALAQPVDPSPSDASSAPASQSESLPWTPLRQGADRLGLGGHARFDYFTASKRLDGNHNLPGLTFQPKALPKFGSWGDAKVEGRLTDQDLKSDRGPTQARLLEAYANLYFGAVDLRIGKQNIPWGRADAFNPTDNLTAQDYTVLSALYEADRRTGTFGVRANYYHGAHTVTLIWLPLFNPSTIPLTAPPGIQITEEKASHGDWTDQGFAAKWDHTGGQLDWSVSYYHGRNLLPVGQPLSPTQFVLIHNRLNVIGADFATTLGQYGIRGEAAYVQTQDWEGTDPIVINPSFTYVLGADRDLTDDLNVNVQVYQRFIINFHSPFDIPNPILQNVAILNATVNQQLNQYQGGFTGRVRSTWWNKTLEAELLGVLNLPRRDFYLRPLIAYAFSDVWKGYMGVDLFNGQRTSYFGRIQPASAFFLEVRASF
jgi:hypothetical protein